MPKSGNGEREIVEARKKLEELNRFKNHLLSLASHEIKSPLSIIKGYATGLREGLYGQVGDKVKETLSRIEFSADELISLVDNIIDLRRIEEGRMKYEFSKTDLVGLSKDVVLAFEPVASGKKLNLSFKASARDIFVNADPTELKHAIQNLVDNAIKYTPKGFVKVEVSEGGSDAVFSVEDSGIGIPKNVSPLLFQEFVRDDRVRSEIRGSGIGLHITKSIIEAHDGKIWVKSGGEGKGSTFYFSLAKV